MLVISKMYDKSRYLNVNQLSCNYISYEVMGLHSPKHVTIYMFVCLKHNITVICVQPLY